jgi:hypothetical protein
VVQPSGSPWLPIAVAPTAAVLPIRQTSTQTRPAGIDLQVRKTIAPDAFHQAPSPYAPMPIAVPAFDGQTGDQHGNDPQAYVDGYGRAADGAMAPPMAPAELAAPVVPAFDPADWGLDVDPAPATGRRRGAAAELHLDPRRPESPPSLSLPTRLFGKGKSGAARLLVLALVVGAEGVAVSSMAGHARTAPVDPSTENIAGAYEFTALSAQAKAKAKPVVAATKEAQAQQQALALAESEQASALAKAQDASSKSKVTAALQQAQAAADRVRLAAQRRDRAMRNAQKDPRALGRIMAAERGWGADQYSCLLKLWNRESQWKYNADNPSSSAYGIPQALPGNKMASAGADWRTNPKTQIEWGLGYIADRYGTPCGAWGHSESVGWY